jgi:hypothetical protein
LKVQNEDQVVSVALAEDSEPLEDNQVIRSFPAIYFLRDTPARGRDELKSTYKKSMELHLSAQQAIREFGTNMAVMHCIVEMSDDGKIMRDIVDIIGGGSR